MGDINLMFSQKVVSKGPLCIVSVCPVNCNSCDINNGETQCKSDGCDSGSIYNNGECPCEWNVT